MESPNLTNLVRESCSSGTGAQNLALNEQVRDMQAAGHDIINFSFGQSPFPPMPLMVETLRDNAHRTKYESVKGILPLRESIVRMHAKQDGLQLDPASIVVGPGSKELIYLLMAVFNGDVILPSPAWVTYKPQAVLAGHDPAIMELRREDGWRVTPAILEEVAVGKCKKENKLLIFCNPDNPTGASYTREQLQALVPVIRKHNIVVLSDEIYGYLEFSGHHETLASICPERTILSAGLSKWACAGGWRLGYHAFPAQLSDLCSAVTDAASHTFTCASAPIQYAAEVAFRTDMREIFTSHCSRILAAVAKYVCRTLSHCNIAAAPPSAGFYVFADFESMRPQLAERGITTCNELFACILDEASVALLPAGPCLLRPESELTARLSFTDFDGKMALDASQNIPLSEPLPEGFVEANCERAVHGMQRLADWALKLQGRPTTM